MADVQPIAPKKGCYRGSESNFARQRRYAGEHEMSVMGEEGNTDSIDGAIWERIVSMYPSRWDRVGRWPLDVPGEEGKHEDTWQGRIRSYQRSEGILARIGLSTIEEDTRSESD